MGGRVRPTGLRAFLRRGPTVSPPPSGSQISWARAAGRPNSSASSSIPCRRCLGLWARCCPKEGHRKRPPCDRRSLQRPLALQTVGISAKERPVAASLAAAPQQGIVSIMRMRQWDYDYRSDTKLFQGGKVEVVWPTSRAVTAERHAKDCGSALHVNLDWNQKRVVGDCGCPAGSPCYL